jgi:hypothetical protein
LFRYLIRGKIVGESGWRMNWPISGMLAVLIRGLPIPRSGYKKRAPLLPLEGVREVVIDAEVRRHPTLIELTH